MKLEVLTWFFNFLLNLLGKCIEVIFRLMLLCLPLCAFVLLIQFRNGGSRVSNLTVYTNDNSIWQFIFPGFILVSVNPNQIKNSVKTIRDNLQEEIKTNKYILMLLFIISVVSILILDYVK